MARLGLLTLIGIGRLAAAHVAWWLVGCRRGCAPSGRHALVARCASNSAATTCWPATAACGVAAAGCSAAVRMAACWLLCAARSLALALRACACLPPSMLTGPLGAALWPSMRTRGDAGRPLLRPRRRTVVGWGCALSLRIGFSALLGGGSASALDADALRGPRLGLSAGPAGPPRSCRERRRWRCSQGASRLPLPARRGGSATGSDSSGSDRSLEIPRPLGPMQARLACAAHVRTVANAVAAAPWCMPPRACSAPTCRSPAKPRPSENTAILERNKTASLGARDEKSVAVF